MNRLAHSHSPYLLQHRENPVDWYEWGEEAFEKAREEDKPVFLSIGYSTCHWCHVMAHESFEDEEVAKLLNQYFICVKVDREERPDIDRIYMEVCQALTGHGGWPLTVVMDAERKPFFAGTYFPKDSAGERHGMLSLIPAIAEAWKNQRAEVLDSAENIVYQLAGFQSGLTPSALATGLLEKALGQFESRFDPAHGGFGSQPKFPSPHNLKFLLDYGVHFKSEKALAMVRTTLRKMRQGGIYDQVGFGFHRYSTDRHWLLPHFEKMLYDQSLHVLAYVEASQVLGDPLFRQTAEEILTYVARDLGSPEGGFFSAEDADSEGEEGKFYVWTTAEIKTILGKEDGARFAECYGLSEEGNFSEEHSGRKSGANIPHLPDDFESRLAAFNAESCRQKLFAVREKRIRPFLDDKCLADWNGLMLAAFSRAAFVFSEPRWLQRAAEAAAFIDRHLFQSGKLVKRYRRGESGLAAHLDDYAYVIYGLLYFYEASFETRVLDQATRLLETAFELFWDEDKGGFYFTSADSRELPIRSMEFYDGALPSGNAVMAWN
ncbi:MAG: thioredoxin domain-containing protein, partial [Spirochaetia bacterium]|nr:thioredoxin domain-containing protein [Spirochaetia bacterium]